MNIFLSNVFGSSIELIRHYYASVINSILIRLVSMVNIVLLGAYLVKTDYSIFLYSYNLSMIVAGMLTGPVITYLLKEHKLLSVRDYLTVSVCYVNFLSALYVLAYLLDFFTLQFEVLYLVLVFNFIQQFLTILCIQTKREIMGAVIALFVNITMWCMFWLFYILDYSKSDKKGYVFIVLCLAIVMQILVKKIIYEVSNSIDSKMPLNQTKSRGIIRIIQGCTPLVFSSIASGLLFFIYFYVVNQDISASGHDDSALFNLSYQWFQIVIFFSMAVSSKFLYKLQNSIKLMQDGLNMMFVFVLVYCFSIGLFCFFYRFYVVDDYDLFLYVGVIIITASLFSAFSNLLGAYLVHYNKINWGTFCNVVWGSGLFVSYWGFQNYFGPVLSVACSLLFSYVCHFLLLTFFVWRFSR